MQSKSLFRKKYFYFLSNNTVNSKFFIHPNSNIFYNNFLLRRSKFFFKDYFVYLKYFFQFFRSFFSNNDKFFSMLTASLFFNSKLQTKKNLISKVYFIGISDKKDTVFSSIFSSFSKHNGFFHFSWDISNFFNSFFLLASKTKGFYPIFLLSPNLISNSSYTASSFFFNEYPHFIFLNFDSIVNNKYLFCYKQNKFFPCFFNNNFLYSNLFFWLKLLKQHF